jgi:hypothetical protein
MAMVFERGRVRRDRRLTLRLTGGATAASSGGAVASGADTASSPTAPPPRAVGSVLSSTLVSS